MITTRMLRNLNGAFGRIAEVDFQLRRVVERQHQATIKHLVDGAEPVPDKLSQQLTKPRCV